MNPWELAAMDESRGMHAEQEYIFHGPPPLLHRACWLPTVGRPTTAHATVIGPLGTSDTQWLRDVQ